MSSEEKRLARAIFRTMSGKGLVFTRGEHELDGAAAARSRHLVTALSIIARSSLHAAAPDMAKNVGNRPDPALMALLFDYAMDVAPLAMAEGPDGAPGPQDGRIDYDRTIRHAERLNDIFPVSLLAESVINEVAALSYAYATAPASAPAPMPARKDG